MSYILDALKKSEQERGHGGIPGVQTVHSSSLNYSNKKVIWPYILIVAVMLNLIAIIYFVMAKDSAVENSIDTAGVQTDENKTRAIAVNNNLPDTLSAEPVRQAAQAIPVHSNMSANRENNSHLRAAPDSNGRQIGSASPVYNSTAASAPDTVTAKSSSRQESAETIEFYELPESIKQQLPAIIISAHVYSTNPMQRSIVVNNNFMEEGEYVIDGLILDEITPDGAIFYYNGSKFHLGVVSGWQ